MFTSRTATRRNRHAPSVSEAGPCQPRPAVHRWLFTALLTSALALGAAACGSDSSPGTSPTDGDTAADSTPTDGDTSDGLPTHGDTSDGAPSDGDTDGVPTDGDTDGTPTDGDTDGTTTDSNGCEEGETLCGENCVDTRTDAFHCGECENLCDLNNSDSQCVAGECVIETCEDGWESCDGLDETGCEANVDRSLTHCGGCDAGCELPNALVECSDGDCTLVACEGDFDEDGEPIDEPTFANCDEDEETGCEAVLASDPNNCGACDVSALDSPNVADAGCSDGVPTVLECEAGFANCDGDWATGCEASTDDDETCGSACIDCTTLGGTGVALECTLAGTTHICSSAGCAAGQANCDGDVSTCETDIAGDPDNCGGCGLTCDEPAGGTATCAGGECGFTCDGDFEACGDECVDLQTSDDHCSACGEGCGEGETCSNGFCVCATNFTNCGDECVDNFQNNRDHCGECNNACGSRGPCSGGTCACDENHTFCRTSIISSDCCNDASEVCEPSGIRFGNCECARGYADCSADGEPRDCRNLQSDRNNCGSCGHQCAVFQRCTRGTCGL